MMDGTTKLTIINRTPFVRNEDTSFWSSLHIIVTNPTFVFLTIGVATECFVVQGFATFLSSAVQSMFALSSSVASFCMCFIDHFFLTSLINTAQSKLNMLLVLVCKLLA
jgi:predicted permease